MVNAISPNKLGSDGHLYLIFPVHPNFRKDCYPLTQKAYASSRSGFHKEQNEGLQALNCLSKFASSTIQPTSNEAELFL